MDKSGRVSRKEAFDLLNELEGEEPELYEFYKLFQSMSCGEEEIDSLTFAFLYSVYEGPKSYKTRRNLKVVVTTSLVATHLIVGMEVFCYLEG